MGFGDSRLLADQAYRRARRKFRRGWAAHPPIWQYDIVHFHSSWELVKSSAILRGFQGKVILSSHSPLPWHIEYLDKLSGKGQDYAISPGLMKLLEGIEREAYELADFVMAPCESALDGYRREWAIFEKLLACKGQIYIPTAINPSSAAPIPGFRKSLGMEEDSILFLFVGRHNEAKGYDLLVQASESLFAAEPQAYVVVAGKDEPLHGPSHPHWIELGWRSDIPALMESSDWLVLPNRETYFDLALLEAMAAGLPAVLSAVGGNLHFSALEGSGFLFHCPGEHVSLAQALMAAASMDSEHVIRFKARCRERVLLSHGFDQYHQSYQESLRRVFVGGVAS
ncbi:MAG: glycosyltransferase family 4 protein [Rectinemataceae bacterium]